MMETRVNYPFYANACYFRNSFDKDKKDKNLGRGRNYLKIRGFPYNNPVISDKYEDVTSQHLRHLRGFKYHALIWRQLVSSIDLDKVKN
jgi:hypothetical protein